MSFENEQTFERIFQARKDKPKPVAKPMGRPKLPLTASQIDKEREYRRAYYLRNREVILRKVRDYKRRMRAAQKVNV